MGKLLPAGLRIKTEDVVRHAGSMNQLARVLGVSRQAVQQWGDEAPVLQVYRLRELRPEWFGKVVR